ncbi:MAG: V-type ATP synthase subunit I, partial [Oscillibacter sp.]|nr:V-type ATP synthase subunit I [Oscillibacter sp.]
MAIVKMKRLRVIAMADGCEELLKGLLRLGCVEISEPEVRLADPDWAALLRRNESDAAAARTEIADVNAALDAVKRFAQVKEGLFIQRRGVTEEEFLSVDMAEKAKAENRRINGLLRDLSRLQTEASRLNARCAALQPWKELDLPLEYRGTAHTRARLEVCPAGTDLAAMRGALHDLPAELLEAGADKQQLYLLLVYHRDAEAEVQETLRPYNLSAVSFQGTVGTAAENLSALDSQLEENRKGQDAAEAALAASGGSLDLLRLYADRLTAETAKARNAGNLLTDKQGGKILFFEGWVPAEKLDAVKKFLDGADCAYETADPAEDENPPVKLKNNFLTRP